MVKKMKFILRLIFLDYFLENSQGLENCELLLVYWLFFNIEDLKNVFLSFFKISSVYVYFLLLSI